MLHRSRRLRRFVLCGSVVLLQVWATPAYASVGAPTRAPVDVTSGAVAKRGDRSTTVEQVQQQLIAAGITVRGGADGVFGAGTEAAVKAYQGKRGLTASGIVNIPTATALGVLLPTPLLAKGSSGASVVQMQQQLVALGITLRGGADGVFGSGTETAVKTFQTTKDLPATGSLDAATAEILANAAASAPSPTTQPPAAMPGLAAFPVTATCRFADTWGAPRSGGRKHQGVDIAAASGTALIAVQNGRITKRKVDSPGSLSGNALWLTARDGTYYFYAHLSAFADGVGVGSPVKAGDLIGYVGTTGNAGVPHLHFEAHRPGGAAVNPYPLVKAASNC